MLKKQKQKKPKNKKSWLSMRLTFYSKVCLNQLVKPGSVAADLRSGGNLFQSFGALPSNVSDDGESQWMLK